MTQSQITHHMQYLTLPSVDRLCKQFGPRSGLEVIKLEFILKLKIKQPIIVLFFELETVLKFYNLEAWTDLMFDTLVVFLKEFFEKANFEKKVSRKSQPTTTKT